MLLILEIFGGVFSIAGSYLISKATNRALYLAFIAFFISNFALLAFFTLHGKIPMIVQMALFLATSVLGIKRLSTNKKRDITAVYFCLVTFLGLGAWGVYLVGFDSISFEITTLEVIAATGAIIGCLFLSAKNLRYRDVAYILFILADVLFVYIGYANAFYVFMSQSFFYIYMSSIGLYKNHMHIRNAHLATQ